MISEVFIDCRETLEIEFFLNKSKKYWKKYKRKKYKQIKRSILSFATSFMYSDRLVKTISCDKPTSNKTKIDFIFFYTYIYICIYLFIYLFCFYKTRKYCTGALPLFGPKRQNHHYKNKGNTKTSKSVHNQKIKHPKKKLLLLQNHRALATYRLFWIATHPVHRAKNIK